MGFGDKLKGFRDQAQQAVADNKDKIQGTLQNVGETANAKTHGKYADKIAKVGEKVSGGVEKFASTGGSAGAEESAGADESDVGAAPSANEAGDSATSSAADETASSAPPEFE